MPECLASGTAGRVGSGKRKPWSPTEILARIRGFGKLNSMELLASKQRSKFSFTPMTEGGAEIERARHWFRELRDLRDRLFSAAGWSDRPGYLSMGMSHDFETAIEEGATHVRVGSALFGPRPEAQ